MCGSCVLTGPTSEQHWIGGVVHCRGEIGAGVGAGVGSNCGSAATAHSKLASASVRAGILTNILFRSSQVSDQDLRGKGTQGLIDKVPYILFRTHIAAQFFLRTSKTHLLGKKCPRIVSSRSPRRHPD